MLWLGRHPIPSLPPPWQILFPGTRIGSKENAKLRALSSGHLAHKFDRRKRKLKWSSGQSRTNKACKRREKCFPSSWSRRRASYRAQVLQAAPREQLLAPPPMPLTHPWITHQSKNYLKGRGSPGKITASFLLQRAVPKQGAFSLGPWKHMSLWGKRQVLVMCLT